jgi:hypothetical protein
MSRSAKNHPEVWRLRAVMECLNPDYGRRGGQKKFADDIGIEARRFNNIMRGSGLSKQVASAIFHRFGEEGATLSFLYHGDGRGIKPEFKQKLLAWQHQTGKQIFSDDDKAGRVVDVSREIPPPHDAPKTKAKTDVEVDPVARLQEPIDAVRRSMIDYTEPTLRSALAIAGLRVVIAKAQELIAEFEDEANPGGGSLSA